MISEDELLALITTGTRAAPGPCVMLGIRWFHDYDARRNPPGLPDLVLVGKRGVLWRELKSQGGTMRPEQTTWRYLLQAAGQDWAIWRPADLESGRIRRELLSIG